jgi:hypothetical protein
VQTASLYRDAEGRTRADVHLTEPTDPSLSDFTEIIDPVAGYRYVLYQREPNVVHKSAWPPPHKSGEPIKRERPVSDSKSGPFSTTQVESLGTQFIENVLTEGKRTTITYLVGTDKSVSVSSEHWWSPEMKINLLANSFDPRVGGSSIKFSNLLQSHPDPSLFRIADGDTILEK